MQITQLASCSIAAQILSSNWIDQYVVLMLLQLLKNAFDLAVDRGKILYSSFLLRMEQASKFARIMPKFGPL